MAKVSAATVASGVAERLRDDSHSSGNYAARVAREIAKLNLEGRTVEATALASTLAAAQAGTVSPGLGIQ